MNETKRSRKPKQRPNTQGASLTQSEALRSEKPAGELPPRSNVPDGVRDTNPDDAHEPRPAEPLDF